jgi:hypothetical protein
MGVGSEVPGKRNRLGKGPGVGGRLMKWRRSVIGTVQWEMSWTGRNQRSETFRRQVSVDYSPG